MRHHHVETLWAMLKVQAEPFVEVSELIGQLLGAFVSAPGLKPDPAFAQNVTTKLNRLIEQLDAMGLGTTKIAAVRARDHINIPGITIGQCRDYIVQVRDRLPDELGQTCLLSLSQREAELYASAEPLFGRDVERAFPRSVEDIDEAGKCLALGRNTACVFHLMRALELAVQALSAKLGVNNLSREWGKLLSEIGQRIEEMPKGAERNRWSENFSLLYHVKQSFRNDTMHPKQTYTSEEAEDVLAACRSFMQNLAPLV